MDPFNLPPQQPQQQQQQTPAQNIPGTPQSTQQPSSAPAKPESPMDKFSDVFDTAPQQNTDGKSSEGNKPAEEKPLNYSSQIPDQKKFDEVFQSVNLIDGNDEQFTALAQKALKEGDAGALSEVLNMAVRKGMSASVAQSAKLSGRLLDSNVEAFQKQTGSKVSNEIRVAGLRGQLLGQHSQLQNVPADYLNGVIEKFVSKRGSKTDAELMSDISEWAKHSFNLGDAQEAAETKKEEDAQTDWSQNI